MADPSELVFKILASEEGRKDPYPLYDELRSTAPVFQDSTFGFWYLSRFDDCREVLRHPSFGKSEENERTSFVDGSVRERSADDQPSMLFQNPPDHTRIRKLVSRAFTPRRMAQLQPSVAALTDELLDDFGGPGDEVDLIDKLGFQLPIRVIAAMVGIPEADRDWFRPRTASLVRTLEPTVTPEEWEVADAAYVEVDRYIRDLVAKKRTSPGDDLLSDLIQVEEAGDRLSEEELISNTILMFSAGFETTTNLIGNGVLAILENRHQLDVLRDQPAQWPTAIDEMLRFDGPVQLDVRTCLEPAEVAGQAFEPGTQIMTLLGAANRDPAAIERPNEFDVTRDEVPLLSFASGIHFCLGAALARMEGLVSISKLFERFPDVDLAETPTRKAALTIRGFDSLLLRL